jgi:restriction system protein
MAKKSEKLTWVIRAGRRGKANDLFIEESVIALEDAQMLDLSKLNPTREAFFNQYVTLHPDDARTGAKGIAGKFYRFAKEISCGDRVLYPCLLDKRVYVGEVTSEYRFVQSSDYPHQRQVKWKWVIPKIAFSTNAQYELGAARTFFSYKRNKDELVRLIQSEQAEHFKKSPAPKNKKS